MIEGEKEKVTVTFTIDIYTLDKYMNNNLRGSNLRSIIPVTEVESLWTANNIARHIDVKILSLCRQEHSRTMKLIRSFVG